MAGNASAIGLWSYALTSLADILLSFPPSIYNRERNKSRPPLSRALLAGRFMDELHQSFVLEGFRQEAESPCIESGLANRWIVPSGDKNNPCLRRVAPEAGLHFQTVHVGHPYVEDCYATSGMFKVGKKVGRVAKFFHGKTGRCQQPAKRLQHGSVIVEQPDTIAGGSAQRRAFRPRFFASYRKTCIRHNYSSIKGLLE